MKSTRLPRVLSDSLIRAQVSICNYSKDSSSTHLARGLIPPLPSADARAWAPAASQQLCNADVKPRMLVRSSSNVIISLKYCLKLVMSTPKLTEKRTESGFSPDRDLVAGGVN